MNSEKTKTDVLDLYNRIVMQIDHAHEETGGTLDLHYCHFVSWSFIILINSIASINGGPQADFRI
jgi:hypothetical protein